MSALDQAFIKAFEKQSGQSSGAKPSATTVPAPALPGPPARLRRVATSAPIREETIDEGYAQGAWYRIDRPTAAAIPTAPAAPLSSESHASKPATVLTESLPTTPVGKPTAEKRAESRSTTKPTVSAEAETQNERESKSAPAAVAETDSPSNAASAALTPEEIAQLMAVEMTSVVSLPSYDLADLASLSPQVEATLHEVELPVPASIVDTEKDGAATSPNAVELSQSSEIRSESTAHKLSPPESSNSKAPVDSVKPTPAAANVPPKTKLTKQSDDRDVISIVNAKTTTGPSEELPTASQPQHEAEVKPKAYESDSPQVVSRPLFQAEWEVDQFVWPEMCTALYRDQRQYFSDAGRRLKSASGDGLNVLALTSPRRGDGKTTLALCLARCAVQAGVRVALIDADFAHPQLQSLLGMHETCSWHESLTDSVPLGECAIVSRDDELVVFPLSAAARTVRVHERRDAIAARIQQIAEQFELVIVDLGSLDAGAAELCDAAAMHPTNAVILVRDLRRQDDAEIDDAVARIQSAGISAVGIAENFGAREANMAATKRSA